MGQPFFIFRWSCPASGQPVFLSRMHGKLFFFADFRLKGTKFAIEPETFLTNNKKNGQNSIISKNIHIFAANRSFGKLLRYVRERSNLSNL